jgi:hypothetical protein
MEIDVAGLELLPERDVSGLARCSPLSCMFTCQALSCQRSCVVTVVA